MTSKDNKKPALIEFNDAIVTRGATVALRQVNLSIEQGENVAIIGPNGSGKSTLIKIVTRECYPLSDGPEPAVKILGESTWDVFRLRSMLGIVSSDLQQVFNRSMSGREMVLSGFFSSTGIFPHNHVTADMEHKTDAILKFLEMDHLAARDITCMSSGQARRMLIARALVHNPHALMLDEPTSALDPQATGKFLGMLRKIARAGKSIIMVTHHLSDIIPEINRVIMLKDGAVFADAPKADLLNEKTLSDLFSVPVEVQERSGYYYLLM